MFLIGCIAGVVLGLTLVYRTAVSPLHKKIEKFSGEKQLEPYMDSYPFDTHNFRFIGDPIDGLQFEDNRILFVKFNLENSEKSKKIKKLVDKKLVEWLEIRV